MENNYVIGISALYHDSAVCLINNGEIIFAIQEERLTRIKHDPSFPSKSLKYIFKKYKLDFNKIEAVVFYDKPFLKFERILETYLSTIPWGFKSFALAMPIWIKEKLFLKNYLSKELKKIDKKFNKSKLRFTEHHFSHAASAFYPSPFDEAIILTLDGVGEWATSTISIGKKNKIKIMEEINFPHSLGLLYSSFTYYLGFKVNSGEYKLMGLAPYGKPIYKDLILNNLIDLKIDGSFKLNLKFFNFLTGLTMINSNFEKLFGKKIRKSEMEELDDDHMNIASSIQFVTEEIVLRMCRYVSEKYKLKNLCLSGGVALNCVANGKIVKENIFEKIWIQPASGDAGGSLGAALGYWYHEKENVRQINNKDTMSGSYLGPEYKNEEIEKSLINNQAIFLKYSEEDLIKLVAKKISEGKVVGWFQGKAEFGPRALGNRSIIADPRNISMQKNLNLKVKFRESFRPFAPAVLLEDNNEWFEINKESPYMLIVSDVKKNKQIEMTKDELKLFGIEKLNVAKSTIPAVTHVDYSARVQTVDNKINTKFYNLIKEFKNLTNCPILINTSFNVRGEPIVCNPTDAFKCFMGTDIDILCMGNYLLEKDNQDPNLKKDYKNMYNLD
ncbi:MAG: hypothetical protein CMA12_08650 [Euryarchaeota archaeon]|nr:hypothetical protein [Euryarchaeota archaeon]